MKVLYAVAALIVYGSLYPFDFSAPDDIHSSLSTFIGDLGLWTSRGDVLGNVGLFVPYGFAGSYAPGNGLRRQRILPTILGGLALAFLLQVAQIWVPSRSAVLADVFWNGVGLAGGVLAASLSGMLPKLSIPLDRHRLPVLAVLALWVLAELAPLVPSIDLAGFRSSLRFLRTPPTLDVVQTFYVAAKVVLAGRLIAELFAGRNSVFILAGAVAAVVLGKVVVVSLSLDWTSAAGLLGGFAAWAAAAYRGRPPGNAAVVVLASAAFILYSLAPFEIRSTGPFYWVPLASVLEGGMLGNLRSLASTAFVLGGLLWLLRDHPPTTTTIVVTLAVLGLEIAQVWIEGRTAGTTEPTVAIIAGWALAQSRVSARSD